MGNSLMWRHPDPKTGAYVDCDSQLVSVLMRAFGSFPMVLSTKHLDVLTGIEASDVVGASELCCLIRENGEIELFLPD